LPPGTTLFSFDIDLSDVDRGVYAPLNLRVAQHPSELPDHLVTRVLAYCLEHTEGIEFTKGLSEPDEPALWVRDLTGQLQTWIDVGLPSPERLHRAAKAAPRVAVYIHKEPTRWMKDVLDARIHRAAKLEAFAFDRDWLAALTAKLDRRNQWSLARSDGQIYLTVGDDTLETVLERPLEKP